MKTDIKFWTDVAWLYMEDPSENRTLLVLIGSENGVCAVWELWEGAVQFSLLITRQMASLSSKEHLKGPRVPQPPKTLRHNRQSNLQTWRQPGETVYRSSDLNGPLNCPKLHDTVRWCQSRLSATKLRCSVNPTRQSTKYFNINTYPFHHQIDVLNLNLESWWGSLRESALLSHPCCFVLSCCLDESGTVTVMEITLSKSPLIQ